MKNSKNLKFTNELKGLGPKLRWFLFTQMQDLKLTSEYINSICPDPIRKDSSPLESLEKMVRQSLIREFSPEIQNTKSFELLVDTVMNNIQKKALEKSTQHLWIERIESQGHYSTRYVLRQAMNSLMVCGPRNQPARKQKQRAAA